MMKCFFTAIVFFIATTAQSQVGVGTSSPSSSAKLEVAATNKGFLPPRVALTATNSNGPITAPVAGLIVYNTATAGSAPYDVIPGMYYYNGSNWILMASSGVEPAGRISAYAGSSAPAGYLICNGSAVSRTTYATLFSVIGTTYGSGDGSTTFNLPDLRGRTIIGVGQGTGLTNRLLNATGGEESHTLTVSEMPAHNHSINDPGHSHIPINGRDDGNASNQNGQAPSGDATSNLVNGYSTNSATTGISINNNGSGSAHNTMMPFVALNYIIKY